MTTSFYLEHYLDSLDSLPGELRRNFTLMHDMDDKNRNILRDVDAASDEYLRKVGYWNIIPFNYPHDIILSQQNQLLSFKLSLYLRSKT